MSRTTSEDLIFFVPMRLVRVLAVATKKGICRFLSSSLLTEKSANLFTPTRLPIFAAGEPLHRTRTVAAVER